MKDNGENEQVFICFDGPDGLVIQTTRTTFESFYRLLGWELLGPAKALELSYVRAKGRRSETS